MDTLQIPADMIDHEAAEKIGCKAVVSIRDLLVLLGASDEVLRDCDERDEILAREPWRRDGLKFRPVGDPLPDGTRLGFTEGEIDWSGTRFEKG